MRGERIVGGEGREQRLTQCRRLFRGCHAGQLATADSNRQVCSPHPAPRMMATLRADPEDMVRTYVDTIDTTRQERSCRKIARYTSSSLPVVLTNPDL